MFQTIVLCYFSNSLEEQTKFSSTPICAQTFKIYQFAIDVQYTNQQYQHYQKYCMMIRHILKYSTIALYPILYPQHY